MGFLKILKGTPLAKKVGEFGIVYDSKPPYEVLYTKDISYEELVILKGIAFLIDKYYNSGKFLKTLEYLEKHFKRPFDLYFEFYRYWKENKLFYKNHSLKALYNVLYDFSVKNIGLEENIIKDLLKFDFLYSTNAKDLPDCVKEKDKKIPDLFRDYLKNEEWLKQNLPQAVGLSSLELSKRVSYAFFEYDVTENLMKKDLIIIFLHSEKKTYLAKIEL